MYKIFIYDEDPEAGFTATIDEEEDEEFLDFIVPLLNAWDEGEEEWYDFVCHFIEEQFNIKLPPREEDE